ncbi:MAG TPA: VOC family protein [Solirubrobacterales bacterium]|jgi:predicted enzyme related to lactoylglutathione lyase|nr:VOC family protein [Solirubrobacterales bacterium]
MPERDRYIPGVPCWADTSQPDPEAATEFYSGLFGWEFQDSMPPDSPGSYFIASLKGKAVAAVGAQPEGAPPEPMWNTYVSVASADETAQKVRDAGGTIISEPFDVMDAGRMAVCMDPEGAAFCIWQSEEMPGSQLVNEHGTVNFNVLNTRDAAAAKKFYGAVFGWGTLGLGGGVEMWTLDGYGDHLEEIQPGTKEAVSEVGGPEGFADVVASLVPIGDDQPDTPAHWSVTFAVDDADAIAARAAELGGSVVVPPFDAPWVRTTVLADPAGASFSASKFVLENKDL